MPLNLQDPYNQAYKKLVGIIAGIRSDVSKSHVYDPMSKFYARIAGSRVWLLTEFEKAKSENNASRIEQIEKILKDTDCDVRVEYRGEKPVTEQQFNGAMHVYHTHLNTKTPPTNFNTSFYTTLVNGEDPKFEVSFQIAHIKPRSNFDAYINEKGNYVFESDDHKEAFDRFINEDVIETFNLQELIDSRMGDYAADSNLASLLKSYQKPLMLGKTFSIQTAAALDKFLNHQNYTTRLGKVKGHFGRLYVGKDMKKVSEELYEVMVNNSFNRACEMVNQSLINLKQSLVDTCQQLESKLNAGAEAIKNHDDSGELEAWNDKKDDVCNKLHDASTLNDIHKLDELKKAMQNVYDEGMAIYSKIEEKAIAVAMVESEQRLEQRMHEINAKMHAQMDKGKGPAGVTPRKKKKKKAPVKNAAGCDLDEIYLDSVLEEAVEMRRKSYEEVMAMLSEDPNARINAFLNALKSDKRLPFLSSRDDTFNRGSKLFQRLTIANTTFFEENIPVLIALLRNFNATVSSDFAYNNGDESRLDVIKKTLTDWIFAIQNPSEYVIPDEVKKTLEPAQALLSFLKETFAEGVETHPLYVHLTSNIQLMRKLAGDVGAGAVTFDQLEAFNAKTAEIYTSLNSEHHNVIDSLVQAQLVDKKLIVMPMIRSALRKIGELDGLACREEFDAYQGQDDDSVIIYQARAILNILNDHFIEKDPDGDGTKPRLIPKLKNQDEFIDESRRLKIAILAKYHSDAGDVTPAKFLRSLYVALMDLESSFFGMEGDSILKIRAKLVEMFLACVSQPDIEMVVKSQNSAEDVNGALLQKLAKYYLSTNPLDQKWEKTHSQAFYALLVEAARITRKAVQSLDLSSFMKWICKAGGRKAAIDYFLSNLDEEENEIARIVNDLTPLISSSIDTRNTPVVQSNLNGILTLMKTNGQASEHFRKDKLSHLKDLVNHILPVEDSRMNRYEQARVYMRLIEDYLVEHHQYIPDNIAQEIASIMELKRFLETSENLGYERGDFYRVFADEKMTFSQKMDEKGRCSVKVKAAVTRHREAFSKTNKAFSDPKHAEAYREIIYLLLKDNGVYQQNALIDIIKTLATSAAIIDTPHLEKNAFEFNNHELKPLVDEVKKLYLEKFFKTTSAKTKLNPGYNKSFKTFQAGVLKLMHTTNASPRHLAEAIHIVLTECRNDIKIAANTDYCDLHELVCLTFLKPSIQHTKSECGAPSFESDGAYIEHYAKILITDNPYQIKWDARHFSTFYKLLESQIKAAIQGAKYHMMRATNNQEADLLRAWTVWNNQFERQLVSIQSDEGMLTLHGIFTRYLPSESLSASSSNTVLHMKKGKMKSMPAVSFLSGATPEEESRITDVLREYSDESTPTASI